MTEEVCVKMKKQIIDSIREKHPPTLAKKLKTPYVV